MKNPHVQLERFLILIHEQCYVLHLIWLWQVVNHSIQPVTSLRRMTLEVEDYMVETQAGFRKERGCRDNIYILGEIIDEVIRSNGSAVSVFIDYIAAFDSVSHHFLDMALGEAGASDKSRAIFRAIYTKASAMVRVKTTGDQCHCHALLPGVSSR